MPVECEGSAVTDFHKDLVLPSDWTHKKTGEKDFIIKIVEVEGQLFCKIIVCVVSNTLTINVHSRDLPDDHPIYERHGRLIQNLSHICPVLDDIESYSICSGNYDAEYQDYLPSWAGLSSRDGTVSAYREGPCGESYETTIRSVSCCFLTPRKSLPGDLSRCLHCSKYRNTLRAIHSRKRQKRDNPELPSSHTPLSHLSPDQLRNRLQARTMQTNNLRLRVSRLEKRLQDAIDKDGVILDEEVSEFVVETMKTENASSYPKNDFASLFWDQQQKAVAAKDPRSVKWHPMIIRWALSIRMKSSAAYEALRNSGCLKLPSTRTLQDYTHVFKVKTGFQPEAFAQMSAELDICNMSEGKKFVSVLQDEVKIQSDLVFDKHTGELVGFIDLGNVGNAIADFEKCMDGKMDQTPTLAKYMLVLMVRGLASSFKFALAHFPCTGITADFLFPILWEAVEKVEILGLKVLCVTCDGATPNRKFFQLHGVVNGIVVYKTDNPWADDDRPLYFVSDAPHLLKTARNCFSNSYGHKRSRTLWRNGRDISWKHIVDLYNRECDCQLRLVPKLTRAHVFLSSFATMRVKYAAQVLSFTLANALELTGGPAVSETVRFIRNFDRFFDCLNVRSLYEHERKRKPFLAPYTDVNDARFHWLEHTFLADLKDWEREVQNRPGNYRQSDRAKMILSYQTLQGLEITIKSFVESCRYMLNNGVAFVLSENYNQDPLEQWFSLQRAAGGANENPTVDQFNNNTAALRLQKSSAIASVRGNCQRLQPPNVVVDNTPLPKRQRKR